MKNITGQEHKRGRPRQDRGATVEKEQRIIEAAKKLFKDEGFDAVSMRKIAGEVGMGTMTLYQYFPNKNAILHHIWNEFFVELFEMLQPKVEAELTQIDKFKAACHGYLNYWFEYPDRFRMVFLNEDRAEKENDFFIHHANIEEKVIEIFLPLALAVLPCKSSDQFLLSIRGILCFLHGVALNLITISEYQWPPHKALLDNYLAMLLQETR